MITMSVDDLIENLAKTVEGEKANNENILIFTLSTCMWCKKCKTFLNDRDMKYKYIDVDKIDHQDKSKILDHLRSKYQERISYPFLICDKGHVVGYNPNKYVELLEN